MALVKGTKVTLIASLTVFDGNWAIITIFNLTTKIFPLTVIGCSILKSLPSPIAWITISLTVGASLTSWITHYTSIIGSIKFITLFYITSRACLSKSTLIKSTCCTAIFTRPALPLEYTKLFWTFNTNGSIRSTINTFLVSALLAFADSTAKCQEDKDVDLHHLSLI